MALGALFYPKGTKQKPISFDSLFIPYIYKEIYFEGVYNDIVNGREDMVIVDVGANIGVVTQYLRNFAKKLYAIEPSDEHFEALKKNKEFNEWDNVEMFKLAIADKDGEMNLSKNIGNRTMNSLMIGEEKEGGKYQINNGEFDIKPDDPYSEKEKVKTMAFDTFFEENKIEQVDFMKFDVEGAEDMIIFSDGFEKVAPKIKAIEIEFHFPTFPKIVERMMKLGYEARRYNSSAVIILFTRK